MNDPRHWNDECYWFSEETITRAYYARKLHLKWRTEKPEKTLDHLTNKDFSEQRLLSPSFKSAKEGVT